VGRTASVSGLFHLRIARRHRLCAAVLLDVGRHAGAPTSQVHDHDAQPVSSSTISVLRGVPTLRGVHPRHYDRAPARQRNHRRIGDGECDVLHVHERSFLCAGERTGGGVIRG